MKTPTKATKVNKSNKNIPKPKSQADINMKLLLEMKQRLAGVMTATIEEEKD